MKKYNKVYIFRDSYHRGLMGYYFQVINTLYRFATNETGVMVDLSNITPYFDSKKIDTKNVWEYYFEQPFNINLIDDMHCDILKGSFMDQYYFFGKLTPELYSKAQQLKNTYIKIKPHILSIVDDFYTKNMLPYKVLGVQKRGTDHYTIGHAGGQQHLMNYQHYFNEIDKIINNYEKIFLISDEQEAIEMFQNKYKNQLIFYPNSLRAPKGDFRGVHNSIGLEYPYKMGEDVLVESLLLSKTNYALITCSSVSNASISFNENLCYKHIDDHVKYG